MSGKNGPCSSEAMDQIIGNMTAEMQKSDGQYVPLGFTQSPTASSDSLNWASQHNYVAPYVAEPVVGIEQCPGQTYGYMPSAPHIYESNSYKKNLDYDVYKQVPNGSADCLLDYRLLLPQPQLVNTMAEQHFTQHPDNIASSSNHTHLIEHLVGNWVVPNNNGTYSPFGNPDSYKLNVFDERDSVNLMHQIKDESKLDGIQFNREFRKPRMVAEVKPMRPSYSDVLTKPVPQTTSKPLKNESKETKPKKDGKKIPKGEKDKKNSGLNRSNTNNELKDLPLEKNFNQSKTEKLKSTKNGQLGRKWASLDNISDPHMKLDDAKRKKNDDNTHSKNTPKQGMRKLNKTLNDIPNLDAEIKCETFNVVKNCLKKVKPSARPKSNDFGTAEKPLGKRNQRTRKRECHVPFGIVGQKLKQYTRGWLKIFTIFVLWLFHLISDICSLSAHIGRDMATYSWKWLCVHWALLLQYSRDLVKHVRILSWIRDKFKGRKKTESRDEGPNFVHNGLQHNINMPTTGDEAMKRLLACKDKDPYSILGVTPTCTDDDIKRYYKRQAFLVHPDKNNQPGAEEAFKILVHAFDMIGEPERRASYDRGVVESAQVVQAWSELTELLQQLQRKVEAAANTIRCSACGLRHKRTKVERPSYAARNCNQCRIHHSAREGDIWAEARVFGLRWHYFACMEGSVYDITEWAACQKDSLKHLRPDSHHVQYRIALGKQNNQPKRHSTASHTEKPDLENLLNTLYGQNDSQQVPRRRNKKTNK